MATIDIMIKRHETVRRWYEILLRRDGTGVPRDDTDLKAEHYECPHGAVPDCEFDTPAQAFDLYSGAMGDGGLGELGLEPQPGGVVRPMRVWDLINYAIYRSGYCSTRPILFVPSDRLESFLYRGAYVVETGRSDVFGVLCRAPVRSFLWKQ